MPEVVVNMPSSDYQNIDKEPNINKLLITFIQTVCIFMMYKLVPHGVGMLDFIFVIFVFISILVSLIQTWIYQYNQN